MISVGLSEAKVSPYLQNYPRIPIRLTVACVNSPDNVTVSGDEVSIDALKSILNENHIFARKLAVNVAYHSRQMNEIANAYLESIQGLQQAGSHIESPSMISSVTGDLVSPDELGEADY